jgi:hypothetical protein
MILRFLTQQKLPSSILGKKILQDPICTCSNQEHSQCVNLEDPRCSDLEDPFSNVEDPTTGYITFRS